MDMPKLEKTTAPGIFRRHATQCPRSGRCNCSYVVVWRHRGRQHTDSFRTFAEAREAKGAKAAGDKRPVARLGFAEYFDAWIVAYGGRTARGFSERSRSLYRRSIEDMALPEWQTWKLGDIEPMDVRDLYGKLHDDGASRPVLRGLRAALSALFATAVEDGLLRANPVHNVRIPGSDAVEDDEAKALTRAELALVLAAMPEQHRFFFELLAHTGLRISEAIGLRWVHVDLGTRPHLRIREQVYEGERQPLKSRHSRREIPLSPGMAERLRAHRRDSYSGDQAPVFATAMGTELSRPNVHGRVLKPNVEAIGLGWVTFHTFRHTCASLLFANGKNVKQVQQWLGHADPGFTLRTYVHLLDEGVGAADFLDSVVTVDPTQVNAGSTEGPQIAANAPPPERAKSAC